MSLRALTLPRPLPAWLRAGGYGALFGLSVATLAGGIAGVIADPLWRVWSFWKGEAEGFLPGLVAGPVVGLLTQSHSTFRRMWVGALAGLLVGGLAGAHYGLRTNTISHAWLSPGNDVLHCGVIAAAVCAPAFAWVAALVGALTSPRLPVLEAPQRPDGSRNRSRWTAQRRDLLLFGMARTALIGCAYWAAATFLLASLLQNSLVWDAGRYGLWLACGPHALLGTLLLSLQRKRRIGLELLLGGLCGLLAAAAFFCLVFVRIHLDILIACGGYLAAYAGMGMGAGLLTGADLARVRARLPAAG